MNQLEGNRRFLQIAFNGSAQDVRRFLPRIPYDSSIFIEAGTPFIKLEGMRGVQLIRSMWKGVVVADLKISDGAVAEIEMAKRAGASAVTVLGSAPMETLDLTMEHCKKLNMLSMVDMLGVSKPLRVILNMKVKPDVVVLHKGRDEEGTKGKTIPYKQVNKLRSKYTATIAAAGGVDIKEARSAIFNGAKIVVANLVSSSDPWTGINMETNVGAIARKFLHTVK